MLAARTARPTFASIVAASKKTVAIYEKLTDQSSAMRSAICASALNEIKNVTIMQQFIDVINQEDYTPQDVQAIFTRKFTTQLVSLIESNGLKPHDVTAIFTSLRERNQYSQSFKSSIKDFSSFLARSNMEDQFIKEMENATNEEIIKVIKTKLPDGCYHTGMHALEMASDVRKLLTAFWSEDGTKPLTIEQRVLIEFSALLAATHDIIQHAGPFANEEQSATEFVNIASNMLDKLQNTFMNSLQIKDHSGKNRTAIYARNSRLIAEAREIFGNLKKHLPFMAREGIVNGTYLAGTTRKNFGCIIQKLADAVDPAHPFHISQQNNGLIDLHTMRCAIGFCDTSRTLLKLVLLDKDNKTIQNLLDKFVYSAVANFVGPLMLSYAVTTAFLQRLGQSLRMFPEINKFRKGETKLSAGEMKFYLDKISESRSHSPTPPDTPNLDAKEEEGIVNEFDMLVSILKKYYGTIPGEQGFAKSQDPQEHLDQCESCGIPNLLAPRIVRDGWTTHVEHLEAFKNHVEALIKEDTEDSKQELAQLIIELLYVAANQSGVTLYEQRKSLQRQVSIEGRRLSGAYEASLRRGSVSAQLLGPQLERILSAKRNSNPEIIAVGEGVISGEVEVY